MGGSWSAAPVASGYTIRVFSFISATGGSITVMHVFRLSAKPNYITPWQMQQYQPGLHWILWGNFAPSYARGHGPFYARGHNSNYKPVQTCTNCISQECGWVDPCRLFGHRPDIPLPYAKFSPPYLPRILVPDLPAIAGKLWSFHKNAFSICIWALLQP